ncbi:Siderophore-interacting FAD-binding domain-containing protein [Dyella sp. 333MFSha]|nr:Siderophore-interacting FAD-binding domain-containing protein [Dyella sp. 333MFSha]
MTGQPGRFGKTLTRMFMKQAQVTAVETLAGGFHLISLQSDAFRDVAWAPGQKVQVAMGSAFTARTFTPVDWNAISGRTRIVGYAHGDGPGSQWLRSVKPGAPCDVFGPRASLDLSGVQGEPVVFGDETSMGLVYALAQRFPHQKLHGILEVSHAARAGEVIARLALEGVEIHERLPEDAHFPAVERRFAALAATPASFVLTGKATSIQHASRALKALGVSRARMMSKAYWSPGKTGLD